MEVNIYGAFRSGTNYVKALLELNCDVWVRTRNAGFKHGPVPALFDEQRWVPRPSVGVVKDPFAWLPSLWSYASGPGKANFEVADTWGDFLVSPLIVFSGGFEGFPRYWYRTPIDYWTAMVFSFRGRGTHLVRYEDALSSPEHTCERLATDLGIRRTSEDLVVPTRRMQRGGDRRYESVDDAVGDEEFDRDHYTDRRYMDKYSPEEVTVVNELLVTDAIGTLGYTPG